MNEEEPRWVAIPFAQLRECKVKYRTKQIVTVLTSATIHSNTPHCKLKLELLPELVVPIA